MSGTRSFSEKMSDLLRHILSCCDKDEGEEERPALQISGPTNFRREDISIPGLDPEQQRFIREKAISDAGRMWDHLQSLRPSPSGRFASPNNTATLPSREQFTTPHSADTASSPLDRIKAHSRKISNSLTKPLGGYQAVGKGDGGSPYEMRALMDPSRTQIASTNSSAVEKSSAESFSVAGSEEDRDSGKGMLRL